MPTVVRNEIATFVNADCVTGARALLADASVDLIVTDPPYGIGGDRLHAHYNRDERFVVDGYVEIPPAEYAAFTDRWVVEAERVLRPGGSIYVVSGYSNLYAVLAALRATSLTEINHLIWKYNFGVHTRQKYVSSHYHILYYEKPGGRRTFNLEARFGLDEATNGGSANYRDREDVWVINREYKPGRSKNKNELPGALLMRILQYSSNPGDLVCDFFLGGGSTGRVAIGLGRRFVGFEISRQIFEERLRGLVTLRPGELLGSLRVPAAAAVLNRGKRWTADEIQAAAARFRELAANGLSQGEIVATLARERQRGLWAIRRFLKRHGLSRRTGAPAPVGRRNRHGR